MNHEGPDYYSQEDRRHADQSIDQKAKNGADLSVMPKVVQEMLRFDPPSHLQGRVTTRDVELHGVTIPADSRVMLATAASTAFLVFSRARRRSDSAVAMRG